MNRSTNVGTWTPAGGFATVLEAGNPTSSHQLQVQDQFVTTTGAFASTGTHSTAVTITSLIATYKVGGAGAPPPPPAPVTPTVTAQSPTPNATGVATTTTVTATFSTAMNAATITTATFSLRAAGAAANVPATVTLDAAGTIATLTPTTPLAAGTVFTATVAGTVTSAAGTAMGANVTWSFTTAPAAPVAGAIARVQQVSGVTFFDLALPITMGNTTTGNTLLVAIETNNDVAVSSITDSQGNSYVKDAGFAAAPNRLSIWRASNITGGTAPVVTLHFAAKETATAVVAEYSGLLNVAPLDQVASNNQFNTTSYTTTNTQVTNNARELIFGVHMNRSTATGTWTPGVSTTTVLERDNLTSKHQLQVQDGIVNAVGTQTSDGTHSTAVNITSLVVTYK